MTPTVNSVDASAAVRASHTRTRLFARAMGPFLVIVPSIVVVRAPDMGTLASEFFKSDLFVWFAGAGLLFDGIVIIAFHQYWSSLAAVLISLFGWVLALRGLVLLIAPKLYEQAGEAMSSIALIRIIFSVIVLIGLYLTYVGWIASPEAASSKQ
ncbi:MAG: hypothetical protein JO275_00630 [Verrucomicrobia bacterium]|nr:hypothetical protein [Verrucomicrobiota bacterium]